MKKLKDLKKGEMFTLKPIQYPQDYQVFIKGEYIRSEKKYSCDCYLDISYERLLKGDREVYTEFIF